uniref:Uncharacterized protein n=1 Tax=Cannabis sativa TaxID=3483 RepID=A0A803QP93_CANSA
MAEASLTQPIDDEPTHAKPTPCQRIVCETYYLLDLRNFGWNGWIRICEIFLGKKQSDGVGPMGPVRWSDGSNPMVRCYGV